MKTAVIVITLLLSVSFALANGFKDAPYSTATAAGVVMNYRVTPDLQNLDCQLFCATTGWVAVGFIPGTGMQNADIIIGYDVSGVTHIRDDWGTGPGSHASDVSLGGTDDVISASSAEIAGVTQLNFIIPLDSGDAFDHALAIGQTYGITLGSGINGTDNFTGTMAGFGLTTISIITPVTNQDDVIPQPDNVISLTCSPNPFNSALNIRAENKNISAVKIQVFDVKGHELDSRMIAANSAISLNVGSYPAGLYFVKAATPEGSVVRKVLKLR
jgi:hypothetical protein